ncbi:hypothetical protein L1987_01619 [Smallanthus sonchifolius]|uniref:Uncharacterized protein n=1 Tax=Smallanthus sonchifolius TaxID=185202 RepID=A0ACB9K5J8_9ASTR|nr:hypothetical protein L1987_01619 [Smallanthus sonchifolius]
MTLMKMSFWVVNTKHTFTIIFNSHHHHFGYAGLDALEANMVLAVVSTEIALTRRRTPISSSGSTKEDCGSDLPLSLTAFNKYPMEFSCMFVPHNCGNVKRCASVGFSISDDTNNGIRGEGLVDIARGNGSEKGCMDVNVVRVAGFTCRQDGDGNKVTIGVDRTKGVRGKQVVEGESSRGKQPMAIKRKSIIKGYADLMINDLGRIGAYWLVWKARKIKIGPKKAVREI